MSFMLSQVKRMQDRSYTFMNVCVMVKNSPILKELNTKQCRLLGTHVFRRVSTRQETKVEDECCS